MEGSTYKGMEVKGGRGKGGFPRLLRSPRI